MKRSYTILMAVFLLFCFSATAYSTTIDLTGTIRDFSSSHPDMEGTVSGLTTGLVNATLAGDKNPDYIGLVVRPISSDV